MMSTMQDNINDNNDQTGRPLYLDPKTLEDVASPHVVDVTTDLVKTGLHGMYTELGIPDISKLDPQLQRVIHTAFACGVFSGVTAHDWVNVAMTHMLRTRAGIMDNDYEVELFDEIAVQADIHSAATLRGMLSRLNLGLSDRWYATFDPKG